LWLGIVKENKGALHLNVWMLVFVSNQGQCVKMIKSFRHSFYYCSSHLFSPCCFYKVCARKKNSNH
jgi:hypothetical protein